MKALICRLSLNNLIRCTIIYLGSFLLSIFIVLGSQESRAADDFAYMIEDFEGGFVSMPGYGSIPSGWSVTGSQNVSISKGVDSHHGQSSLYAEVTHDPNYYTVLKTVLVGQQGTINLQIQAKAATSTRAEVVLDATYYTTIDGTTTSHIQKLTSYWYTYSSTDWRSMTLEDIEVPSNGELPLALKVANNGGSTDFDFDCLTSDAPLIIDRPDDEATVTGMLALPAEANGREYIVIVDTDTDGDNGFVASTIDTCGTGLTADYSINAVPAGTYYVYACVFVVSETAPPQDGDYIGFYGTGLDPPDLPNAVVPPTGIVTFDITLDTMSSTPVPPDVDGENGDSSDGSSSSCFLSSLFQ